MGWFNNMRSRSSWHYYHPEEAVPQEVRDYDLNVDQGFNAAYYAAKEHYLRMKYRSRYSLQHDVGHERWEEHLKGIYLPDWEVNAKGYFYRPPPDYSEFEDEELDVQEVDENQPEPTPPLEDFQNTWFDGEVITESWD